MMAEVLMNVLLAIVKKHNPSPATDAWSKAAKDIGYPDINDASNPETT